MVRTKDFFVILIASAFAVIGAGFFFITGDSPAEVDGTLSEVLLSTPQDSYTVLPQHTRDLSAERSIFIEKVQREYIPPPPPPAEPATNTVLETTPTGVENPLNSTEIVTSSTTEDVASVTPNYGNANF